jgi:predicted Zn-dependent protease
MDPCRRDSEARNLLTKALAKADDERLRKMLTDMDLADCRRRLSVSSLAGRSAMKTILGALRRTPADQEAAELLLQIYAGGVSFSATDVEATITALRRDLEKNTANAQSANLLGRILAATGDFTEAIRVLQPVAEQKPEFRFLLAQYQLQSGEQSDAERGLTALADDSLKELSAAPDNTSLMTVYVDSLILLRRSEEALKYLNQRLRSAPDSALVTPEWNAKLKSMRAAASLALFDQKTGYSPEHAMPGAPAMSEFVLQGVERADYPKLMNLLKTATTTEATRDAAIQRICGLAMETGPLARRADALMLELRSEGALAVSVLNIAGMEAMLRKQPLKALEYLEMGNVLSEKKDPLILNNLAVAILKTPERDLRKALQCSALALELVPDHPDLLATQGEILLIMGRAADAVNELQKSLREDASNSQTHLLIAEAYDRLKQKQKAEDHRELAASLNAGK